MQSPLDLALAWKGVAVLAWLALFFALERFAPAAAPPEGEAGRRRLARNLALILLTLPLSRFFVVPLSVLATQHALGWRPVWWSGGPALLGDLILLDFLIFWWHRANHELPFLWRFHEVHHLDRFLDTSTALRFHVGEVALSAAARAVVIVLLDIPLTSVLVFEAAVLIAAVFHHSNVALPPSLERALSRVVITPSIHWVHHHRVRRDTDANYGTILSIWDPLFRTRSPTPRTPDMEIGAQGREEESAPRLVLRPFLPR